MVKFLRFLVTVIGYVRFAFTEAEAASSASVGVLFG